MNDSRAARSARSLTGLEKLAIVALITGCVARALWVFVFHQPFDHVYSDMSIYVERATRLADGGELVRFDASYPPGTHLLLTAPLLVLGTDSDGMWGAAVLWWLLSSLTPLFMWRFARYVLTPAAAALTAIFTALWPLHITYAGYFLSDTPSTTFLVAALWLAARAVQRASGQAVAVAAVAGAAGGAAVAGRTQLILNLAIAGVPMLLAWRRLWRVAVAFAAGALVVLAGAITHNSLAAGKLTALAENSGQVFWQGQCNVNVVTYGDPLKPNFVFAAPAALQRGGGKDFNFPDRLPWDQGFFYGEGLECIRENGLGHLRIVGRSIMDMTATTVPWPQSNERELKEFVNIVNVLYSIALPVILFQGFLLIRRRRREGERSGELLMVLHMACGFLTAILFLGDPRYRIPYDAFGLALLAALLADAFFDRRQARAAPVAPPAAHPSA